MKALTQYIDEWKITDKSSKNISSKNIINDFYKGGNVYVINIIYPLGIHPANIEILNYNIYDIKHTISNNRLVISKDGTFYNYHRTEKPGIGYWSSLGITCGNLYMLFVNNENIDKIKNIVNYIITNENKISVDKIFKILNVKCPFDTDDFYKTLIPKNIDDIIHLHNKII